MAILLKKRQFLSIFWKKCQVFGNFLTFNWQYSGGSGLNGEVLRPWLESMYIISSSFGSLVRNTQILSLSKNQKIGELNWVVWRTKISFRLLILKQKHPQFYFIYNSYFGSYNFIFVNQFKLFGSFVIVLGSFGIVNSYLFYLPPLHETF